MFNLLMVFILEREAFIRHFLAKGLEEQGQVFRVARIGAKEAELEYGVSSR